MQIVIIVKRYMEKLRELKRRVSWKRKLRNMDKWWYYMGFYSWELFPPSFYYTHTEKEIERITKEILEETQKLLDQLE